MREVWRCIPFFNGDYEVSNKCRVRSNKNGKCIILNLFINKKGYYSFTPSKNGKTHLRLLHRVIAEAFIPNPNNYKIVRHLNDKPGDNRIKNLAWGTSLDNRNDGRRNGSYLNMPKGESHHLYGKDGENSNAGVPILQICINTNVVIKKWGSASEAAKKLNISRGNISACCEGVRKSTGGFKWIFSENKNKTSCK